MTEEIKEILDKLKIKNDRYSHHLKYNTSYENKDEDYEAHLLLNYITNLQKENEKLKDNQVRALNKIKDYISAGKCETLEGNYSNDEHSQYWNLFNKQLKEIKKLIKGVNINQYINIPKYREKELLNKEEKLEDYKSRNEKAIKWLERHIKMINGLAGNNDGSKGSIILSDDVVAGALLYILQGGDE